MDLIIINEKNAKKWSILTISHSKRVIASTFVYKYNMNNTYEIMQDKCACQKESIWLIIWYINVIVYTDNKKLHGIWNFSSIRFIFIKNSKQTGLAFIKSDITILKCKFCQQIHLELFCIIIYQSQFSSKCD